MMTSEIDHCRQMIAGEEERARQAPSAEAAESHNQLAMLYRIQLHVLQCRSADGADGAAYRQIGSVSPMC